MILSPPGPVSRPGSPRRAAAASTPLHRLTALLAWALLLCLGVQSGLGAREARSGICCRTSGGTRGACLSQWLQLVPASNRFNPGPQRLIALIQGAATQPISLTLQFMTLSGETLGEQTLPAGGMAIHLLTLPPERQLSLEQPLIWETYPSCQPNRPPSRSLLAMEVNPQQLAAQQALAALRRSCGQTADSHALLRLFALEEMIPALPQRLLVSCGALTLDAGPSGRRGLP